MIFNHFGNSIISSGCHSHNRRGWLVEILESAALYEQQLNSSKASNPRLSVQVLVFFFLLSIGNHFGFVTVLFLPHSSFDRGGFRQRLLTLGVQALCTMQLCRIYL
jgi:hypothetical protein